MGIKVLFIYIIASVILFLILSYIDKNYKDKDNVHYGVVSCIYILILSGIFTNLDIYHDSNSVLIVFLLELFIRIFYLNVIEEVNFFKNKNWISRYVVSFIIIFGLNTLFISKVKNVFLDLEEVKIVIWLLIVMYVISIKDSILKKDSKNKKILKNEKDDEKMRREYIVMQYARFKNQYFRYVNTRYRLLYPIIYAIMIYENKNRPEIFRKIDYYLYKFDGKGRKFGIMQIYSKYYIDDENSISIAIRRLEKIYYQNSKVKDIERCVLRGYYHKDNVVRDILFIVKEIKSFNHK